MGPRTVILGGGFGGTYTAIELERRWRCHPGASTTLISQENFYLMTPLLFEAASGELEARHAVNPIRPLLERTLFIEAIVTEVDFDQRTVHAQDRTGEIHLELPYDQLVIALGGRPNYALIPGSEHAMPFKSIADAVLLRNHVLDAFERASIEVDPARRRELLSFVVIGGGLVGVELTGELSHFLEELLRTYKEIDPGELRLHMLEAMPKILPELDPSLARYAADTLRRRGVDIRTDAAVQKIEPGEVYLPGDVVLHAHTLLYAAGLAMNPLLAGFPLEKDRKGRIVTDATLRSRSRPEVWAVGDCASIPDPKGKPYPALAQHALREARALGRNLSYLLRGKQPVPFIYFSRGTLALLGKERGVGEIFGIKVRGVLAWWIWRSYYLFQMPRWERRVRILLDWTIALFFKADTAKLVFHVPPRSLAVTEKGTGDVSRSGP